MKSKLLHEMGGQKTFVLIFETGEEVMSNLKAFAKSNRLAASHFTAIGAFRDAMLGYYDWERKEYTKNPVREQVEAVSLIGDIVDDEKGEPQVHAHVVLGKSDGVALGGHLLDAHVRPTLEVVLIESPVHLRRRFDSRSGLALINF
jgi:predicted DNA-binding protein with PD1-like motif